MNGIKIKGKKQSCQLFAAGMILYFTQKALKSAPPKLLEFSKVTGYKINIWKSAAFLYNNTEISETEKKHLKLHLKE